MKKLGLLFLGGIFLAGSVQALSVGEIVAKANHAAYYKGKDGKAHVRMTITDSQGRARDREFMILRTNVDKENDEGQKFYVYFQWPSDVNQTAFLVWKHVGKDDDRWLYLPALDLVKRIAASDERTSFVGSHFFYEDVSGRSPEEDKHELIEETENFYVLKSTPKKPDSVEFAYFKTWVHKTSFLPTKSEYVDGKGKVYRTYEATKVDQIEGYPTVTEAKITDKNIGGSTKLDYINVSYDLDLPESIFTERYLRNAPRQYFR